MLTTNLLNLAVIAILARRLTPADFGLVAIANVLLQFLRVLVSQGANNYVIYDNEEGREERASAAFWLDLSLAILCSSIGLLLIPFLTKFYEQPELGGILFALVLKIPLDSLSKIPDSIIRKSLDFKKLEIRDTVLEILTGILSVVLALSGFGVWSLVIPALVVSPFRAIAIFAISKWRPVLNPYFHHWPRVFKYSLHVIGNTITTFIISEADTLFIGKLMGTKPLGIYNLSWQSANLVCRTIVNLSNRVTMPALSSVSNDMGRLKYALERILQLIALVTFPLLIGLFVVAEEFIMTLYGPQWMEAVLPMRIMLVYAMRYTVGSPTGAIFKVIGKPEIGFKIGLATVPFYFASLYLGSFYGIVGIAVGITLVRTVSGIVSFGMVSKIFNESYLSFSKPLLAPLHCSLISGTIVLIVKLMFLSFYPIQPHFLLAILILAGGLSYLYLLRNKFNFLAVTLINSTAPILGKYKSVAEKFFNVSR
jgi:O-antigen/teichoic acid export membrane protein